MAALTPEGVQASMTLPGALNGLGLVAYVREVLVPTLRPGQVVLCDNLSVHNRVEAAALITAAACDLLFLPAYSPDFNPIEQAFSQRKTALRRAAARTQDALEAAFATALATITATDAQHWFKHAGYSLEVHDAGQPL